MKKAVAAAVMISGLIVMSFVHSAHLRKIERDMKEQLALTREYIERENYSSARAELEKWLELWEDVDRYTAVLLTDETVSSVSEGYYDVFRALAEQNPDTTAAELDRLLYRMESMADAEKIVWKNIF